MTTLLFQFPKAHRVYLVDVVCEIGVGSFAFRRAEGRRFAWTAV